MYSKIDYEKHIFKYKNGYIQTYCFGTGDRVILALPGYPASGIFYYWFFKHYDLTKIRVITLDIPGWAGFSDNQFDDKEYSINEYTKIILKLIEYYNLNKFSLLGYSFGGGLAIEVNSKIYEKINKICLVSPVFSEKFLTDETEIKLVEAAYFMNLPEIFKLGFLGRMQYRIKKGLNKDVDPNYLVDLNEIMSRISAKAMLHDAHELFHIDWSYDLKYLAKDKLMVVYSKQEKAYFRKQAKAIIDYFNNDIKTLHYHGVHENFLIHPVKRVVGEIVEFLID